MMVGVSHFGWSTLRAGGTSAFAKIKINNNKHAKVDLVCRRSHWFRLANVRLHQTSVLPSKRAFGC